MIAFTFAKKMTLKPSDTFTGAWDVFSHQDSNFPDEINFINNWYQGDFFGNLIEKLYIKLPLLRSLKRIIFSLFKRRGVVT